jgi:hypothetical protein
LHEPYHIFVRELLRGVDALTELVSEVSGAFPAPIFHRPHATP